MPCRFTKKTSGIASKAHSSMPPEHLNTSETGRISVAIGSQLERERIIVATGKYNSPPILEALCELRFAPSGQAQPHILLIPGLLPAELRQAYSGEPREQRVQTVTVPSAGSSVAMQDELFRVQLPSPDNLRVLAIGTNVFSVSMLKPYGDDGWEEFLPRIRTALDAYAKVTEPQHVSRIGLRYINRIDVPNNRTIRMGLFNFADPIEELIEGTANTFMHRSEYMLPDGNKAIISQGTLDPAVGCQSSYILDIDAIWEGTPLLLENTIEKVEELHTLEGRIFESLITDEAREIFNE